MRMQEAFPTNLKRLVRAEMARLTDEEKLHRMKLRLYQRKKESLSEENTYNDENKKIKCPV